MVLSRIASSYLGELGGRPTSNALKYLDITVSNLVQKQLTC
jgi:hypothetical protein